MQTNTQVSKNTLWAGRVMSALPVLFLLMDGAMKLFKPAPVIEATVQLGYSASVILPLGLVLLVCTAIYLVPRTAVLGAILLTGYLGGAVATHVRVNGGLFPILFPVVFGVLLWVGLYLWDGRLHALMPLTTQAPTAPNPTAPKKMLWAGWVMSGLVALMMLFSAVMKLTKPPMFVQEFARLGYQEQAALGIGILEIACTALYLIPRTAVLGAILLAGYLGGATATHVRVADPFIPPIVFGVLAWGGLYLRDERLRALLPLRS